MSFPARTAAPFIMTVFLCLSSKCSAFAQVPAEQRSVVCFDIRISEIRKGNVYQQIDGDAYLSKFVARLARPIDLLKIDRIYGSLGLPQSYDQIAGMKLGDASPFEFFVRIEFSDREELFRLYDLAAGLGTTDTLDGIRVLR